MKIVGSGGGVVIVVLDALAGWEYAMSHQDLYKIRVISNSYGPIGGGEYDPENPLMLAAKNAYEHNITVFFAAGNDGAAKNTLSPYAQGPYVIGVAAGSKDGMLADFSSRGLPRQERLVDANPLNDGEAPTITAPGTGIFFAQQRGALRIHVEDRFGARIDRPDQRSERPDGRRASAGDDPVLYGRRRHLDGHAVRGRRGGTDARRRPDAHAGRHQADNDGHCDEHARLSGLRGRCGLHQRLRSGR